MHARTETVHTGLDRTMKQLISIGRFPQSEMEVPGGSGRAKGSWPSQGHISPPSVLSFNLICLNITQCLRCPPLGPILLRTWCRDIMSSSDTGWARDAVPRAANRIWVAPWDTREAARLPVYSSSTSVDTTCNDTWLSVELLWKEWQTQKLHVIHCCVYSTYYKSNCRICLCWH